MHVRAVKNLASLLGQIFVAASHSSVGFLLVQNLKANINLLLRLQTMCWLELGEASKLEQPHLSGWRTLMYPLKPISTYDLILAVI